MKKLESVAYFTIAKMLEDGRIDVRSIEDACRGKPWGKTHTVINTRRRELQEEGIISNTIKIDFEKLDLGTAFLLIKTTDKKATGRLSNYLKKNTHVYELYKGLNTFDLIVVIHLKEFVAYTTFVESIKDIPGVAEAWGIPISSAKDYTAQRFEEMTESVVKE